MSKLAIEATMKKLILFMLFAVGVYGQQSVYMSDGDSLDTIGINYDWLESQAIVDYSGASKYIIKLWDEYKAKCYADSMPVLGFGRVVECGSDNGMSWVRMKRDTVEWTHKHPRGFEGFMEYLRGKMK